MHSGAGNGLLQKMETEVADKGGGTDGAVEGFFFGELLEQESITLCGREAFSGIFIVNASLASTGMFSCFFFSFFFFSFLLCFLLILG